MGHQLALSEYMNSSNYGNHQKESSPRSEPQLVTPQPTAPTENIEYEIPLGMI